MRDDLIERADRAALNIDRLANLREEYGANSANSANSLVDTGIDGDANSAKSLRTLAEHDASDFVIPPPTAHERMFYGLLGQFAKKSAEGTEVNPVAAMAAAMSYLSACMGRNPGFSIGDGWHHLRLFTLHVGRSSKGGKGMSLDLLKRLDKALRLMKTVLPPQMHSGGLSSREGLAFLIHDGFKDGKEEIPAITDKRLFIVESEFANVLAQSKREGNTLSACLRDVWDGNSIKPATKTSRMWATKPHIALHGCITPSELRAKMSKGELSNGFANRFLIFWAERNGVIPFPVRASDEVVQSFAEAFAKVIEFGLSGYPDQQERVALRLTSEAKTAYSTAYSEYSKRHQGGDLIAGLLERRAPMLLRIAGLFAVTDCLHEITAAHIEAAKSWMDYYGASVHMIFAPTTDTAGESRRNGTADALLKWLTMATHWKSRTEITRDCFKARVSKTVIDEALELLAMDDRIERREVDSGGTVMRTDYRIKNSQSSQDRESLESHVVIKSSQTSKSSQPELIEGEV